MAPTYSLEVLAARLGVTLGQQGGQPRRGEHDPATGYAELGLLLGVSRTTLRRWRTLGLTEEQADRLAIRCGFLPSEVWPEWSELATRWVAAEGLLGAWGWSPEAVAAELGLPVDMVAA